MDLIRDLTKDLNARDFAALTVVFLAAVAFLLSVILLTILLWVGRHR